MKCFKYTNDLGTEIDEIEIPEDHKERAEEAALTNWKLLLKTTTI